MTSPTVGASKSSPPTSLGRRVAQWWLDRSVLSKGLVVIAIPLISLTGVTTASLVLQIEEQSERQTGIAANALSRTSLIVLVDAVDSETGVRGFVATGKESFLGAFNLGSKNLESDLGKLRTAATTDDERTQVDRIDQLAAAHLRQLDQLIVAVRNGNTAQSAAVATLLTDGRAIMDSLRAEINSLAEEPTRLVTEKRESITALENTIKSVEISGLVLGLLAGGAGIALFGVGISRRVRLVADNATRLGAGQTLVPLPQAADELGRLSDALSDAERLLAKRLDEVKAARDEALSANEAKNTFLSRTSHELRTPLNAILGFAQLLEMSELSADDQESASHIHHAGRHLLSLINELIDIARVESGDLQVSMEPISVAGVSQEIVALMTPLAAARDIVIENHIADRRIAVAADHQRLKQVLVNLVSNAVKYNRHAGRITLSAEQDIDGAIRLSVADTGPGLTEAEVEQIWIPFERLGANRSGIEGSGIGLPLARALTEAMHGTLDAASHPGRGSVFTLRLPRAADITPGTDRQSPSVPVQQRGSTDSGRRLTVLSIEDNIANSQVLERIFRDWPEITLIAAANAADGIALAQERQPGLILLDLHLPEVSGEQAFANLRSEPSTAQIPVVVLSADATPGTIRRLLARGAVAYLTKPLDLEQLFDVIEAALGQGAALADSGRPRGQRS